MNKRISFPSGVKWGDIVGYSRAIQIGNQIEFSGTVATDENGVVGKGDMYLQTKFILKKIQAVLEEAGFQLSDVVKTRLYVTDISRWEEVGKAHGEFFRTIKPVTTMLEISKLIDRDYLIEIEATAIKQD